MPRGEFKHRYWVFADTPNIGRNFCVIWKDLSWWADRYRRLKYQGGCTIPLLQISVWWKNCVAAWHYAVIGIQLLFANNRNRVRGAVLGLSQDGACTGLFENLIVNSLKGGLSNDTTFKPPLFSLVNTFKQKKEVNKNYWPLPSSPLPGQLPGLCGGKGAVPTLLSTLLLLLSLHFIDQLCLTTRPLVRVTLYMDCVMRWKLFYRVSKDSATKWIFFCTCADSLKDFFKTCWWTNQNQSFCLLLLNYLITWMLSVTLLI